MKDNEPKRCCVVVDGKPCGGRAFYRVGQKGFCEKHKPTVNPHRWGSLLRGMEHSGLTVE